MIAPLMKPEEVSVLLECSVRTVEDCARAGRLPGIKFGDGWIFPTEALLRAVNRMAEEEAARRSTLTPPAAIQVKVVAKKSTRPNLALLGQPQH